MSTEGGRLLVPGRGAGLDDKGFAIPADLRRQWDSSADGVRRCLDVGLIRLGLDHIDVVLLHDPDDAGHLRSRQPAACLRRNAAVASFRCASSFANSVMLVKLPKPRRS